MSASASWIDVSVPIDDRVTAFPDTPEVSVRRVGSLDDGDDVNISELRLSTHSATHVDAPLHFLADGEAVDELDPEALNGPARVLDCTGTERVGEEQLVAHGVGEGERVLLRTPNSTGGDAPWYERDFDPGYAHLAADGARHLVDRGVAAVGIDYLSIGGEGRDNADTHRILLGAGVAVLEGLALERVEPGEHELRCLSLRISGGDGAPARALLRPRVAA